MRDKYNRRLQLELSLISIVFIVIILTISISRMNQETIIVTQNEIIQNNLSAHQVDELILTGFIPIILTAGLFILRKKDEE